MVTRIILTEDHRVVREGLRALLDSQADLEVVAEADDGRQALTLVQQYAPQVIVMDVGLPNLNGIEATRQIARSHPETKVVALSSHSDKRYVLAMLNAGACGYVLKKSAADELLRAIRSAQAGKTFLSDEVAGTVVETLRNNDSEDADCSSLLTAREREVLQLLAEGQTSGEISRVLHIAPSTVDVHRRNVMKKLDLHSVAELTKYAVREGLTSP